MKTGDIALILASYNGVYGPSSGVGVMTQIFINAVHAIIQNNKKIASTIDFHVCTPYRINNTFGYSDEQYTAVKTRIKKSKGVLHYYIDKQEGPHSWEGITQWKASSVSLATLLIDIAVHYKKAICFSFDTPYCGVPALLYPQIECKAIDIIHIWIAHSTGMIHDKQKNAFFNARIRWENQIRTSCLKWKKSKVGAIGEFMKKHLIEDYNIPEKSIITLTNGFNVAADNVEQLSDDTIFSLLKESNVPLNRKIVFAAGRCIDYKGFHLLIKAFAKTVHKDKAHLVIQASKLIKKNSYFDYLEKLTKKLLIDITFVRDFKRSFTSAMYQYKNTCCVVVPSLKEPFGLIPQEVRYNVKNFGAIPIVSNRGGLPEQIADTVDGFIVDPENTKHFSEVLDNVITMDDDRRIQMIQKGRKTLFEKYDFQKNLYSVIDQLLTI